MPTPRQARELKRIQEHNKCSEEVAHVYLGTEQVRSIAYQLGGMAHLLLESPSDISPGSSSLVHIDGVGEILESLARKLVDTAETVDRVMNARSRAE
jgi:hypothetical protein